MLACFAFRPLVLMYGAQQLLARDNAAWHQPRSADDDRRRRPRPFCKMTLLVSRTTDNPTTTTDLLFVRVQGPAPSEPQ